MINYELITTYLSDWEKSAVKRCLGKLVSLWPSGENLMVLAMKHGADKWTHGYIPNYEKHFSLLRLQKLNIMEIGIAGYNDSQAGGEPLRMWQEYTPNSTIYGGGCL